MKPNSIMLFSYYALLCFALSVTSAAAPTNDQSQQQGAQASSYNFNPQAVEFRPKPLVADGTYKPPPKPQSPPPPIVDGTYKPPPIAVGTLNRKVQVVDDRYMPDYMKADISKMKTAEELQLKQGRLYNIRKYALVSHGFHLRNKFNGMLQGLVGGKDHSPVSVVYNGPVPGYGGKLVFVSLVWVGGLKNFPKEYMEKAPELFEPTSSNGAITFCRRKKHSLTGLQASSVKLR